MSFEFIFKCLNGACEKLNKKDLEDINTYRLSRNLSIVNFDEISSFIRDIKDIIIIKKTDN